MKLKLLICHCYRFSHRARSRPDDQDRRAEQLQGLPRLPRALQEGHGSSRVEEINAAGGVLGRKLEIVSRDDGGTPGDAVRVAEELITREKVDCPDGHASRPTSAWRSPTSPTQRKVLFLASEPLTDKIVWENGNRYTFRLRPSTYMQTAMLVPEAAKLKKKRWAIVYPNYEYGQSATASFKKLLEAGAAGRRSSSPSRRRRSARSTPARWCRRSPTRSPTRSSASLFAADLQKFVREGNTRGLFKRHAGVQPARRRARVPRHAEGRDAGGLVGHRLSLERDQHARAPPVSATPTRSAGTTTRARARWSATRRCMPSPRRCSKAELRRHREARRSAEGPRDADAVRPDRLAARSTTSRPWAPMSASWRAKDGKGVMVNWRYADGAKFQPADEEIRALRKE